MIRAVRTKVTRYDELWLFLTSGRMATAQTAKEWPVRVRLHFLLTQTLAVQSQEPDTSVPNLISINIF